LCLIIEYVWLTDLLRVTYGKDSMVRMLVQSVHGKNCSARRTTNSVSTLTPPTLRVPIHPGAGDGATKLTHWGVQHCAEEATLARPPVVETYYIRPRPRRSTYLHVPENVPGPKEQCSAVGELNLSIGARVHLHIATIDRASRELRALPWFGVKMRRRSGEDVHHTIEVIGIPDAKMLPRAQAKATATNIVRVMIHEEKHLHVSRHGVSMAMMGTQNHTRRDELPRTTADLHRR
jgi:hypothetical protein